MTKDLINRDSTPQWLIWGITGIFFILSIGGAWFFRQQRYQARHQTEEQLLTIARFKANEIAQWRAARLHDAAVLAGDPFFLETAYTWMRSPDPINRQKILDHFRTIQTQYSYWNILLTSPEGKNLLVREGPPGGALGKIASKSLTEALHNHRVVMTDIIPNAGPLPVRLDTIAPLILPSSREAVPFGALVLVSDVQTYLYPVIQSWPIPSKSAESLLVRRDGDSVLYLNELRHRKNTAFTLRFPLTQASLPAVMAAQGRNGVVEGVDYRGVKVFSALQPVEGTTWHLVAKMDEDEALATWHNRSLLIIGLTISLFLAAVAMVWAVWQRRMKVSYRLNLETEKARSTTEQQYGTTLMCIGDGVIVTDAKGTVTLLNPVAEELTGWTLGDALGKPIEIIFNICNETTRQKTDNPIQRVLETGRTAGLANHTILISRSGVEYPIMDSSAPILNASGDLIGIVLVFRNQTAERRAERLLKTERDNLAAILRASPVGLLVFDDEAHLITASPEAERMFQRNLETEEHLRCGEFLGCYNHSTNSEGCGEAELCASCALNSAIRGALREGKGVQNQECTLERQVNGSKEKLFLSFGAEPVILEGHRHAVVVIQDISDRILTEQRNERLTQQLQQAMKMEAVGRLAGGVAHDFNNLLTGIGGYTELLISNLNPQDPMLEDLNEIKKASQRAVTLTSQLLAFSRKQLIEPRVLSLNDLIAGLQKMLQRLIGEDIELKTIFSKQLASVKIDPGQYEQILVNLAVNARDAMPDGGKLTIETANIDLDEDYNATHPYIKPGLHAMLAVSDTGCGMSAEVKSHLFEPFYTTKQKGRGTGLGLATIYGAVKQSGGTIEVYSEPEKGTTFRIYLPAIAQPAEFLDIETSSSSSLPGGEETILIVEDEQMVRELATKILSRLSYNILTASHGVEALEIARNYAGIINLLVTDVVMPGMNGRQLAEQLQQIRPQIKVLFTSGYTENAIAHHGIIDSNLNFIGKPYNSRDLAHKIRRILD
jgi:two-component system, cell cycle sensor histidine kinase and response regulator CckA